LLYVVPAEAYVVEISVEITINVTVNFKHTQSPCPHSVIKNMTVAVLMAHG